MGLSVTGQVAVELILETLKQNGGKAFGEVTKGKVEGVDEITFVYARNPEGNLIELQSWTYVHSIN